MAVQCGSQPSRARKDLVARLKADGVKLVIGTALDYAGVIRSKGVPVRRIGAFCDTGMGASSSWLIFSADNHVAFTPHVGVAGDVRLVMDSERVVAIGDGLAWGPTSYYDQDGFCLAGCPRSRLVAIAEETQEMGLEVLMGVELEFTVTTKSGEAMPRTSWSSYGMRVVTLHRAFLVDLTESLESAGVFPEQVHAEFGLDQFEISLPPAPPVDLADASILARVIIGIVADRHDMAVSFSPQPWIGEPGNGAHLHLSLSRDGIPLLSGGKGPYGITPEGGAAIGGILRQLPDLLAVYAGSAISPARLQPGHWSGASACWGLENREAALRFMAATNLSPSGANLELKVVDPSANIYLAALALLGSATAGIRDGLKLPDEVPIDPSQRSDRSMFALPATHSEILDRFTASEAARALVGDTIHEGLLAVRRHEQEIFAGKSEEDVASALRFTWSA